MKIYADMFKKWSRILDTYQKKDDPYQSSIYFDFVNKYVYFGSDLGKGKMKFFFDVESDEQLPKNFFISTSKFLTMINQYDDITLKEGTFNNGTDKFKISVIEGEDDRVDTSIFEDSSFIYKTLTKNIFSEIETASTFVDPASSNINLQSLFVTDGYISGYSAELPLYESKIDFSENFSLEVSTASLVLKIGSISEGCKLSLSSSKANVKSMDDEILVVVPNNFSTIVQDLRDPEFIKMYDYPTYVKVDKSAFASVIQFMKSYMNVAHNGKFYMSFKDDMTLSLKEDDIFIEKHIPYKDISSEISGKTFAVPGFKAEKALKALVGEILTIKLPVNDNNSLVDFSCDDRRHVIIPRFNE